VPAEKTLQEIRFMQTRPRLASSAIVERDGRFLLVRRRNPPAADLYAFPGGRAEPGETPEETAIRELFEETGLLGREPQLIETVELLPEDGAPESHFLLSVFRVVAPPETIAIANDDALEAGWFLPEQITELPVPESVRACIERLVRRREAG
jgi:ADP-ribose pyrophosphatase YjhB (NUDIX family)